MSAVDPELKKSTSEPHGDGAGSNGENLSIDDAERFAATFRPSWEPPPPPTAKPAAHKDPDPPKPKPSVTAEPSIVISDDLAPAKAAPAKAAAPRAAPKLSPKFDPKPARARAEPTARVRDEDDAIVAPSSNKIWIYAGAGAIALAAVIGIALAVSGDDAPEVRTETAEPPRQVAANEPVAEVAPPVITEAPEPAPEPAIDPATEPGAELATTEVPPEPGVEETPPDPPPPPMVSIRVTTVPENAALTLDGTSVANPYEIEIAQATGAHTLEATLEGYHSETRTIEYTEDQALTIELTRVPVRRVRPVARARTAMARAAMAAPMNAAPMTTMATTMRGAGFVTTNPY
jgi:hypothetical protein